MNYDVLKLRAQKHELKHRRGPYKPFFSRFREPGTPGEALSAFRRGLRLTQAEFAAPLPFVGRTAIANYEAGTRNVTSETLDKIHRVYPTSKDDLPLKCGPIWNWPCELTLPKSDE